MSAINSRMKLAKNEAATLSERDRWKWTAEIILISGNSFETTQGQRSCHLAFMRGLSGLSGDLNGSLRKRTIHTKILGRPRLMHMTLDANPCQKLLSLLQKKNILGISS